MHLNMTKDTTSEVYKIVKAAKENGMSHINIAGGAFTGHEQVRETGERFVNFSLCDYLGISTDEKIRSAAADAVMENGVYAAVSRTYMKLDIYRQAEEAVSDLFQKPVIITPRTTLGHIAAIPVLVGRDDAVILDHQVHTSVRLATDMLKGHGNHVEIIRHNRMDKLEARIQELQKTHEKVWYMADGIYSMYGDVLPADGLLKLLDTYPQFHLYVDDAHGMGWAGPNGTGYVMSRMPYHERMFLATSLGKGFGSGGGALVCPSESVRENILFTGSTLIFTSPPEPAVLGAVKASAEGFSSGKYTERQERLAMQMELFYTEAETLELPVIDTSRTPIAFIAAGTPEMVTYLCRRMLTRGYHITPGVYPATPWHNGGVRVVLSLYQKTEDIRKMLVILKEEYYLMLKKYDTSTDNILKHYKK
jgi:7-keto-8-aminopelargonate synthetase-like enzyme